MTTAAAPRPRSSPRPRPALAVPLALVLSFLFCGRATALCGDISGDGYIKVSDALSVLKAAVFKYDYDAAYDLDAGQGSDGKITVTDALLVLKAAVKIADPSCAAATETLTVATTASCDFATGGVGTFALDPPAASSHALGTVSADAVVRTAAGRVFVLNRYGADNVQELDSDAGMATLWQCSVGNGSNPHDIVIVSEDLGYVSLYDSKDLAIIDPSPSSDCSDFVQGTLDLSDYADADGFPEMDQMLLVGDTLLVVLQRLDRGSMFAPASNGALVAIDTATSTVTASLELSITNPYAETKGLVYDEATGLVYLAGPGTFFSDLDDGGIEAVAVDGLVSQGVLMNGTALGGDLTDLVLVGSSRAYAVVAGGDFANSLVEIDLNKGEVSATLATSDYLFSDIEMTESGRLWLADRDCSDPGLRVFSLADNGETTTAPLYPGLSPFSLTFLD